MNKLPLLILCLINFISTAQTPLTKRETDEIRYNARRKVEKDLPELLNTLNLSDIGDFERKTLILNSYLPSQNQVFYSDAVVIEDDLKPDISPKDPPVDALVDKYLNNLDLFYAKSDSVTIKIENVVVSPVKENKDQITVQVYFTSIFKGSHKTIKTPYAPQLRIAELNVEKNEKKWTVLISSIRFNRGEALPDVNKVEDERYKREQLLKELEQKRDQEIIAKLALAKKLEEEAKRRKVLPTQENVIQNKTVEIKPNQTIYKILDSKFSFVKCADNSVIVGLLGMKGDNSRVVLGFFNVKEGENDFYESEFEVIVPRDFHCYFIEPDKEQIFVTSQNPFLFMNKTFSSSGLTFKVLSADGKSIDYVIPKVSGKCPASNGNE
jgi:hypothetical protein